MRGGAIGGHGLSLAEPDDAGRTATRGRKTGPPERGPGVRSDQANRKFGGGSSAKPIAVSIQEQTGANFGVDPLVEGPARP